LASPKKRVQESGSLQSAPVQPAGQVQTVAMGSPSGCEQPPPFWQGFGSQVSTSSSQKSPPNPAGQLQVRSRSPGTQVPPFWHGVAGQAAGSSMQSGSTEPGGQSQTNAPVAGSPSG
jgi:hypothetical protein